MPLDPGTRLGGYQIVGPLGAGGMGEVYRARDTRLHRDVALKVLPSELATHPERLARLEREARTVAALNHPGIVTLYSIEDEGGTRFLTMELVEGQSLDRQLPPGGLPIARVLDIAIPLADALAAAHAKGVVHRDLKPANIMWTSEGRLKVLDFGLAKSSRLDLSAQRTQAMDASATETATAQLSTEGSILGTAPYMAPEQIRGQAADARTDLFALGIVLHELASGERPFNGRTFADVTSAILRDTPPLLSSIRADVPEELARIISRCLEKAPADRYSSALEVQRDLQELRREIEQGMPRGPAARAGTGRARGLIIGTVVVALAGLALWYGMHRARTSRDTATDAAARQSVAVLEFSNLTGDPSHDWMKRGVSELLSAALVQSPALDVFDLQRVSDLAAPGRPGAPPAPTVPSHSFLSQHGIQRAISGNILRSGGDLRIEGRIVDTGSGRPVHSFTVEDASDSSFFQIVGRLVANLQVALEVNLTGDREAESWLTGITTTSVDAYRLYLSGHEALLGGRWKEAASAFEQALAIDSVFVAARSELAGAYWNLGDDSQLNRTRAAMQRLRVRADHRGQLRIDLLESTVANDTPGLIRAASELQQLYPENRFFRYLLGRGYYYSGQYQRCIDTLRPLVEERYGWSYTYVLTARSAMRLGDEAGARRAFEIGREVKGSDPEFSYAHVRFLRAQSDWVKSREVIDQALGSALLSENPVAEGELRLELAKDLAHRGDTASARQQLMRATTLIPADDEARAEADSMLHALGVR